LLAGCSHNDAMSRLGALTGDLLGSHRADVSAAEPRPLAADPAVVSAPAHEAPQLVADADAPYLLDSGDRVRIFVYGQPSLSLVYIVDAGGFVSMPLIGAVKTRGLTTFDLERAITTQLGASFVRDPSVTVEVAQHRPFFILGEVRTAGQFPYVPGLSVEAAVAIAGGFSERANEHSVLVTRRVNGAVSKFEASTDAIIRAGDTILVRERYF
jgi:polysaccharide export outer membrane protein